MVGTAGSAVRLFLLRRPTEWPLVRGIHQTCTHRIIQNISKLLRPTFAGPQPVFEEVALPGNALGPRDEFFPVPNFLGDWTFWIIANEQMHMIWHHQEKKPVPVEMLMPPGEGLDQRFGDFRFCQNISSSGQRANGHEIDLLIGKP